MAAWPPHLKLQDTLLHTVLPFCCCLWFLHDELGHMHRLGLAQPVGTIHRLVLIGTIPPCTQLSMSVYCLCCAELGK